jgi:cob(I)alamin adenosyltransferase
LKEESFNHPGREDETRRGLVEIYTGEGKGKTTAALGTAIRALGHGLRVYIAFFLKGDYPYGERNILSHLPNVTFASFGTLNFIDPEHITEEERREAALALEAARQAIMSGEYELVIMDEINLAVHWKLISLEEVVKLIRDKPEKVELILTGRYADEKLIRLADLVTECLSIKHPYDAGIQARPGIEY